jgi:hypothetical protein
MPKNVIFVGHLVDGRRTEHTGRFVKRYEGGVLETTADIAEAITFENKALAIEFTMRAYGVRPDRRPNRPITAYNLTIGPPDGPLVDGGPILEATT